VLDVLDVMDVMDGWLVGRSTVLLLVPQHHTTLAASFFCLEFNELA